MRVTSIQLEIKARPKAETLRHVLALLDKARGSDLILLPEQWPCGFFSFDRYECDSETLDGPTVGALGQKARELGSHIHMGSFVERQRPSGTAGDEHKLFNTSVLLGPDGKIVDWYRKIHLFGYQSEERRLLRPGSEVVVAPTPWGRAGLSICYDLRFPELYRAMIDKGADFFLVASGWPAARLDSWVLFNRVRANENLAYLFSCNCAGAQGESTYAGHSLFVDPFGKVLAEGDERECIISADVDTGLVATARREFPALQDRVRLSTEKSGTEK
jgi:predicted amidohydrolase